MQQHDRHDAEAAAVSLRIRGAHCPCHASGRCCWCSWPFAFSPPLRLSVLSYACVPPLFGHEMAAVIERTVIGEIDDCKAVYACDEVDR